MAWSYISDGKRLHPKTTLCPICERDAEFPSIYCSPKCREKARRERKLTRKALRKATEVGFKLTFENRNLPHIEVPSYLSEFYPKGMDSFYVFSRHDSKNEERFIADIQENFRMYVGPSVYAGIVSASLGIDMRQDLKEKYLYGYCLNRASDTNCVFYCEQCETAYLKSVLTASDCESLCCVCCPRDLPF